MAQEYSELRRWQPGDHVLLRARRNQPADVVFPMTVVEDTDARVVLYLAEGTPIKWRAMPDGTLSTRDIPFEERERVPIRLIDTTWHSTNMLRLYKPGRASSILLFWDATDWRFLSYYGNLEAPACRTRLGFDSADYLLDVVIEPDLTWRWKDEDEFAMAQELGIFTPEQAAAIRAEGERVIADVEARRWPFDGGYELWRPEPSWTVPTIPADWERD
jgi:hypothetical protein